MTLPLIAPRRILVVDDEPFVCDAVRMMLNFDGHRVDTVCSAKDALNLFAPGKYDVIITDYAMPAMKGDELALAIKNRSPSQPVVMITAYAEILESKPIQGVDVLVSKPFLLENLREAISKAVPVVNQDSKPTSESRDSEI